VTPQLRIVHPFFVCMLIALQQPFGVRIPTFGLDASYDPQIGWLSSTAGIPHIPPNYSAGPYDNGNDQMWPPDPYTIIVDWFDPTTEYDGITLGYPSTSYSFLQVAASASAVSVGFNGGIFKTDVGAYGVGHSISKLGNSWTPFSSPGGIGLAINSAQNPSLSQTSGAIQAFDGLAWQQMPGTSSAIAVGGHDALYMLDTKNIAGGHNVWQWNGSAWQKVKGQGGVSLAVDRNSIPWITDNQNNVYAATSNGTWMSMPGSALAVAAGGDGSVYALGTTDVIGGKQLLKWAGSNFLPISGQGGVSLAAGPHGRPWLVDTSGNIWQGR
jgi:hypothetical protein